MGLKKIEVQNGCKTIMWRRIRNAVQDISIKFYKFDHRQ